MCVGSTESVVTVDFVSIIVVVNSDKQSLADNCASNDDDMLRQRSEFSLWFNLLPLVSRQLVVMGLVSANQIAAGGLVQPSILGKLLVCGRFLCHPKPGSECSAGDGLCSFQSELLAQFMPLTCCWQYCC